MVFLLTMDLILIKLFCNRNLLHVIKWGKPIFARGGMILEQTSLKHVWGLYTYSKSIKKNCKFEITAAKEQAFSLAHNKWAIATQKQFTTHQVCCKNRKPLNLVARSDCSHTFWQQILSRKRLLKPLILWGLGMPLKYFLTLNLSNSPKQCNRLTIMAFTLAMLPTMPTIWNLKTLMTLFQFQSRSLHISNA